LNNGFIKDANSGTRETIVELSVGTIRMLKMELIEDSIEKMVDSIACVRRLRQTLARNKQVELDLFVRDKQREDLLEFFSR